jgi:aminopeptidase YwaD
MKMLALCCALFIPAGSHLAAQTWQVHPEWVKAHEQFLASDALQGRGSATRDEQIAATYIGSQFESFGLKPAPNNADYVQAVELETVQLDGKAELTLGNHVLHEGADFYISSSPGINVTGSIQTIDISGLATANILKGAAILVQGMNDATAPGALRPLQSAEAGLIVMRATKAQLDRFAASLTTRIAPRIKGIAQTSTPPTIVYLKSDAAVLLADIDNHAPVSLTVHATTSSKFTHNAMAMLPGTDRSGATILITAHLDHVGVGIPVDGDSIYNGANDDASGVTAVLELARALAAGPAPRRNILFVCFGSEELGGYGARWFREFPPTPLKDIVANLEFEMIGLPQEKVPTGTMFLTGWERSNLGPTLKDHGARLSPDPFPEQQFFLRSDNYPLAQKGVVAHTAAAGGAVPTLHQPNDDLQHIDIPFMTELIQSMIEPLRWLANSDFKPAWNPGGQPAGN